MSIEPLLRVARSQREQNRRHQDEHAAGRQQHLSNVAGEKDRLQAAHIIFGGHDCREPLQRRGHAGDLEQEPREIEPGQKGDEHGELAGQKLRARDGRDQEPETERDGEEDDNNLTIVCVDPAPVNCGLAVYDMQSKQFIKVTTKSFDSKKELSDMGNARLLENVASFIKKSPVFQQPNTMVFVENQSVGSDNNKAFSNSRNLAVQYCFQSILGADRCVPVPPASVKAHFRQHFPLLPRNQRTRSRQYRLDKKNAVAFGSKLVGQAMRDKIARRKNKKVDDAYDAVVITQYALECFDLQYVNDEQRVVCRKKTVEKKKKRLRRCDMR